MLVDSHAQAWKLWSYWSITLKENLSSRVPYCIFLWEGFNTLKYFPILQPYSESKLIFVYSYLPTILTTSFLTTLRLRTRLFQLGSLPQVGSHGIFENCPDLVTFPKGRISHRDLKNKNGICDSFRSLSKGHQDPTIIPLLPIVPLSSLN